MGLFFSVKYGNENSIFPGRAAGSQRRQGICGILMQEDMEMSDRLANIRQEILLQFQLQLNHHWYIL